LTMTSRTSRLRWIGNESVQKIPDRAERVSFRFIVAPAVDKLRRAARTDAVDGRAILAEDLDSALRFLIFDEWRQTFRDLIDGDLANLSLVRNLPPRRRREKYWMRSSNEPPLRLRWPAEPWASSTSSPELKPSGAKGGT
jgi:hypothetical protein